MDALTQNDNKTKTKNHERNKITIIAIFCERYRSNNTKE